MRLSRSVIYDEGYCNSLYIRLFSGSTKHQKSFGSYVEPIESYFILLMFFMLLGIHKMVIFLY